MWCHHPHQMTAYSGRVRPSAWLKRRAPSPGANRCCPGNESVSLAWLPLLLGDRGQSGKRLTTNRIEPSPTAASGLPSVCSRRYSATLVVSGGTARGRATGLPLPG